MSEVEIRAADTLLERGVRASMRAPLLLRMLGKKEVSLTFRQPTMGVLISISREYLRMGVDVEQLEGGSVEEAHRLMAKHGRGVARIAAMGWLGTRTGIRLFTGVVARRMLWRLSPQQLRDILLLLVTLSGVQDFTNTIRLLRAMNMMSPKNLSREEDGG